MNIAGSSCSLARGYTTPVSKSVASESVLLPDHRAYQAECGGTLGRRSGRATVDWQGRLTPAWPNHQAGTRASASAPRFLEHRREDPAQNQPTRGVPPT